MTPSPLLLATATALAISLAAPRGSAQEQDWDKAVAKACEHRRYGMRRAVSRKIAEAGDEAVPAVRAYAAAKTIPLLLVDAIARADTRGDAVLALLEEWAQSRDFYWRSQALGGLAHRKLERLRPLYLEALRDASHLFRIEGARGLHLLDPERDRAAIDGLIENDPDPRVRMRLAALLTEGGDHRFVGVLVAALDLKAEFLGDPWGKREADRAVRAIRPLIGDTAIEVPASASLRASLRGRGVELSEPDFGETDRDYAGGLGIRSCRNGDLFLRWTDTGEILVGLLPQRGVTLPAAAWTELSKPLADLGQGEREVHGRVVCDYLELVCGPQSRRIKYAPGALPSEIRSLLAELTAALRATPNPELADELSGRLEQFAAPGDK